MAVVCIALGLAACHSPPDGREIDADLRQIEAYRAEARLLEELRGSDPPAYFAAQRAMLAEKVADLRRDLDRPGAASLEERRRRALEAARRLEAELHA